MSTSHTYQKAYEATKRAMAAIKDENGEYRYKGYSGASAVSMYVHDKYEINVVASPLENDGFVDAFNS